MTSYLKNKKLQLDFPEQKSKELRYPKKGKIGTIASVLVFCIFAKKNRDEIPDMLFPLALVWSYSYGTTRSAHQQSEF